MHLDARNVRSATYDPRSGSGEWGSHVPRPAHRPGEGLGGPLCGSRGAPSRDAEGRSGALRRDPVPGARRDRDWSLAPVACGKRSSNGAVVAEIPRPKGASKSQIRKSRKAIRTLKRPASSSSRNVLRIWSVKISPTVTSAPVIRPNQTTPGMVAPAFCPREPRASSTAATWSTSGWYACPSWSVFGWYSVTSARSRSRSLVPSAVRVAWSVMAFHSSFTTYETYASTSPRMRSRTSAG